MQVVEKYLPQDICRYILFDYLAPSKDTIKMNYQVVINDINEFGAFAKGREGEEDQRDNFPLYFFDWSWNNLKLHEMFFFRRRLMDVNLLHSNEEVTRQFNIFNKLDDLRDDIDTLFYNLKHVYQSTMPLILYLKTIDDDS